MRNSRLSFAREAPSTTKNISIAESSAMRNLWGTMAGPIRENQTMEMGIIPVVRICITAV